MDWDNPDVDELEWATIKKSGPEHDIDCTRRINCSIYDEKYATHYVYFERADYDRGDLAKTPFFYSCKECIPDAYWALNDSDVSK